MVRLFELAARRRLALAYLMLPLVAAPVIVQACYSTGDGSPPPPNNFYFPVGMTVSKGGNVLYVVNSDFDLQYNGGTIQSYDLYQIRRDAALSAAGYALSPDLPIVEGGGAPLFLDGAASVPAGVNLCAKGVEQFVGDGGLISSCAPLIDSNVYVRDSVTIGAFATDLQLSPWGNRLYAPVRGDASLTWLTVTPDTQPPTSKTQQACDADGGANGCYGPFTLQCGQAANGGRCDATHHAGVNPNEPGNTRNLTMPGEPFAMAQTAYGTAIVITHQSEGDTSLFLTGLTDDGGPASPSTPSMQYIIDAGLPLGGDGIGDIPHDPAAFGCPSTTLPGGDAAAPFQFLAPTTSCPSFPNPALLETNNTAAELNVIRYYSDDGTTVFPDAAVPDANLPLTTGLQRPFITVDRTYPITTLSSGTDSRGIAFDTSQRLKCEHMFPWPDAENESCAQKYPARVYIANRAPNSLIIGTVGGPSTTDPGSYDSDAWYIAPSPAVLDGGSSRVYVAPIIDSDGNYEMRVFVVCFDQNSIDIINPDTQQTEAFIPVGQGPFALTFDPFVALDVALNAPVKQGPALSVATGDEGSVAGCQPSSPAGTCNISLPTYRFAYVASFTDSYVQVIDLDDSQPDKSTFETVVYTLGTPIVPVGNQ